MDLLPPPSALIQDDPAAADSARRKVAPKSRLFRLFSSRRVEELEPPVPTVTVEAPDSTPITLDCSSLEDVSTDRYEWAILYENQRGLTAFSIPYYSSLSLLPSDPSPFTLPNTSLQRSKQPPVSLDSYPLPDGNWHWVSRCWMIDMRSNTGEVQHDGFEYNWMFRQHHWRAQIGSFNAGGWVRRRRWVRLMVRPAKQKPQEAEDIGTSISPSMKSSNRRKHRQSMVSSSPASILTHRTDTTDDWTQIDPDEVWLGDPEADYKRCCTLMKRFGRDGRKLELWRLWLGFYHPEHKEKFIDSDEKGKRREKQWTEDEGPLPSEVAAADILSKEYVSIAPRQHVVAVLRIHGEHILHLYVFPESRVQFLKLLDQAGLLPELNKGLGIRFGLTEIDFWSYASGLGQVLGADDKALAIAKN